MNSKPKGFTLIELIVVIAIIAILAGLVLVRIGTASEDARKARVDNDLQEIIKAINLARIKEGKVLKDITGSGCSACACSSAECNHTCEACKDRMDRTMQSIGFSEAMVNPWGKYYMIDENELEFIDDPCRKDSLISVDHKRVSKSVRVDFFSSQCF